MEQWDLTPNWNKVLERREGEDLEIIITYRQFFLKSFTAKEGR